MKLSELLRDIEITEMHAPEDMEISGVAYDSRRVVEGGLESNIVQFFSDVERQAILSRFEAEHGDVILMIADPSWSLVCSALGQLRLHLAQGLVVVRARRGYRVGDRLPVGGRVDLGLQRGLRVLDQVRSILREIDPQTYAQRQSEAGDQVQAVHGRGPRTETSSPDARSCRAMES